MRTVTERSKEEGLPGGGDLGPEGVSQTRQGEADVQGGAMWRKNGTAPRPEPAPQTLGAAMTFPAWPLQSSESSVCWEKTPGIASHRAVAETSRGHM